MNINKLDKTQKQEPKREKIKEGNKEKNKDDKDRWEYRRF